MIKKPHPSKGKVRITDGYVEKFIYPHELDAYRRMGWMRGVRKFIGFVGNSKKEERGWQQKH